MSATIANSQPEVGLRSAGLTDGELLERFTGRRDEAAFEVLLHRHGPMVWGVCRRMLNREADAEDAFQATFLVLIRKATTIRPPGMVGNWLYGVAHTTALKARAMRQIRTHKEAVAARRPTLSAPSPDWNDLRPIIDSELAGLPAKYRAPIVMCDVEGRSLKEAARHLGCPLGTVGTRVARGRALLARRLTRRGVAPTAALLAILLSEHAATAAVPGSLTASTLTATGCAMGIGAASGGAIAGRVQSLVAAVLKTIAFARLRIMAVVLLATITVGLSGAVAAREIRRMVRGAPDSMASDLERLDGPWIITSVVHRGEALAPGDAAKYGRWTFDTQQLTLRSATRGEGTFRLAPGEAPREIDVAFADPDMPDGLPRLGGSGIYLLHGCTLTICLTDPRRPDLPRPRDFSIAIDDTTTTAFVLHRKSALVCRPGSND